MSSRKERNSLRTRRGAMRICGELAIAVFVVFVFLTLAQCTIKKPESPQWDTNLTVPLINRTYPIEELIDRIDQDGLIYDSTSDLVTFSLTLPVDTLRFDSDQLNTSDLQYLISQRLGNVTIDPPTVSPVNVTLSSIAGLSSSLPNDSTDVTPTAIQLFNTMPSISTFSLATFTAGTMRLRITNNLGVTLDTLYTQVYDLGQSSVVSNNIFVTPIASGQQQYVDIPLAGKMLSNNLRVTVNSHTPGGSVTAVSSRMIATSVEFPTSLTISAATAQVPQFTKSLTQPISIDQTGRIDQATLETGTFRATVTNATNIASSFTITVPDLYNTSNQPLSITRQIGAFETVETFTNLVGYRLVPTDLTVPQQIQLQANGTMFSTGTNQVQIRPSDSIVVIGELSNLSFSSLTGAIDSTVIDFDNIQQEIDVPLGLDSASIEEGAITLEIANSLDMPGSVDITLQGNNGKVLHLAGTLSPGTAGQPSHLTLTDTTAADFFSPIPSQVTVVGSAVIGDGSYTGTITKNDYIVSSVLIYAPLVISIPNTTFDTDIEDSEIESDDMDAITEHVTEAQFVYSVINHLPVGASVSVYISNDSATVFSNPKLLIDSIAVGAAPVSLAGIVTDTSFSGERTILLDSADIQLLNNPVLYIGQRFSLESSGGQYVRMTGADYLHVSGYINVQYRFDGNF